MTKIFIFGMGYSGQVFAQMMREKGATVNGTGRGGDVDFADQDAVKAHLAQAHAIFSFIPPDRDAMHDPVLHHYRADITASPAKFIGYVSATGVYGDAGGAWVDETAPTGHGRRKARAQADHAWQDFNADNKQGRGRVSIFRLPGIYGAGRSVLDAIRNGRARRIDAPGQFFSRVHVDDIASGLEAGMRHVLEDSGNGGIYNLADHLPSPQHEVVAYGCRLLGVEPPEMQSIKEANLSPMAMGFYSENRKVANIKAQRILGWRPQYGDYKAGLNAILAAENARP